MTTMLLTTQELADIQSITIGISFKLNAEVVTNCIGGCGTLCGGSCTSSCTDRCTGYLD